MPFHCRCNEEERDCSYPKCHSGEKDGNPQADLLEKLDMIKEAVERNPDEWWREMEGYHPLGMAWVNFEGPYQLFIKLNQWDVRLKPQRVKVEGWVDAEVIQEAKRELKRYELGTSVPGSQFHVVAEALLQLVKEDKTCEHGKGLDDYCEPCGRIHGGP